MLYVSRYIDSTSYGVVDTDDDVEQIVHFDDLFSATFEWGLKIAGVVTGVKSVIRYVMPYQDPRYYSTMQAKYKAIYGVDIITYKDEIVGIVANGDVVSQDIQIRVSDFCSTFNVYSVIQWKDNNVGDGIITLIFDDKMKFTDTLAHQGTEHFMFDFTELSDDKLVNSFYERMVRFGIVDVGDLSDFVVDDDIRINFWKHIALVEGDTSPEDEFLDWYMSDMVTHEDYSKRIAEMYRDEFESLTNIHDKISYFSSLPSSMLWGYVTSTAGCDVTRLVELRNYDAFVDKYLGFFSLIRIMSTLNSHSVLKLERFIKYFVCPSDLQKRILSWVRYAAVELIKFGRKMGAEV